MVVFNGLQVLDIIDAVILHVSCDESQHLCLVLGGAQNIVELGDELVEILNGVGSDQDEAIAYPHNPIPEDLQLHIRLIAIYGHWLVTGGCVFLLDKKS